MIIPAKTILILTSGEYSDFSLDDVLITDAEIDTAQVLSAHPEATTVECGTIFATRDLGATLIQAGLAHAVDYAEWWCNDYPSKGRPEKLAVDEPGNVVLHRAPQEK